MPGGVVADPARIRNQTEDLTAAGHHESIPR
jgi:hypothetical protein